MFAWLKSINWKPNTVQLQKNLAWVGLILKGIAASPELSAALPTVAAIAHSASDALILMGVSAHTVDDTNSKAK